MGPWVGRRRFPRGVGLPRTSWVTVAEQGNFTLKKDIREQAPNKRIRAHQDLVMAVLGCLKTWLSPIQDVDANTDALVTLMAPTSAVQLERPAQPKMGGC